MKTTRIRLTCLGRLAFSGILVLLLTPSFTQTATPPSAGTGTQGDPYLIATLENLYWIRFTVTYGIYFIQTADIDASPTAGWFGGQGWIPIQNFRGHYNGDGYVIDHLTINRPGTSYIGLFSRLYAPATVENLGLKNITITGYTFTGGLTGQMDSSSVSNCYTEGTVSAGGSWVGGLIGCNYFGGIVNECYSTCNVTGTRVAGGLIGSNLWTASVSNCYSTGDVTGNDYVGGLIGNIENGSPTVNNSYSTGVVSGGYPTGGFIGRATSLVNISNCFWDTESSAKSQGIGSNPNPPPETVTGLITAEMKTQSTFTGAGWDFETIWAINSTINEGYPFLINTGGGDCTIPPVANAGEDVTIYIGYPPYNTQLNAAGGISYSWSPTTGLSDPNIANPIAQPGESTTYTVTVTDVNGCSATDDVFVDVMDVRCGNNMNKVLVCHVPPGNPNNAQTLCVAYNAVAGHLAHGDYLGECTGGPAKPAIETEETLQVTIAPNPFDQQANIILYLLADMNTDIAVYNLTGTRICTLNRGLLSEGNHTFTWNGADENGNVAGSGLYILRVTTSEEVSLHKIVKN